MTVDLITDLKINYRCKDGWHIFTSKKIPGLYIASQDLKVAFDDIPEAIKILSKTRTAGVGS